MSGQGFFGQQSITDAGSEFNSRSFATQQSLGRVRTMVPVKIVAVHGGGVAAPPTVDVQPLINQIDGQGNATPHGIVYGIPCSRSQGGGNAVINDPAVGDIGHIIVADRDISQLKANAGAQSNPGSFRRFSMADGVYQGAILNSAPPTQWVHFTATGIEISDKNGNKIVMGPSGINLNGVIIDTSGNVTSPAGITAGLGGADAVTLAHHTHASNGTPPTAGT